MKTKTLSSLEKRALNGSLKGRRYSFFVNIIILGIVGVLFAIIKGLFSDTGHLFTAIPSWFMSGVIIGAVLYGRGIFIEELSESGTIIQPTDEDIEKYQKSQKELLAREISDLDECARFTERRIQENQILLAELN